MKWNKNRIGEFLTYLSGTALIFIIFVVAVSTFTSMLFLLMMR